MAFRPETARPINELVDILLQGPHTLSRGERELIATFVSEQNDCRYCQTIHGAIAAYHLHGDEQLVVKVKSDPQGAPISDKLKALLTIAGKTAESGNAGQILDVSPGGCRLRGPQLYPVGARVRVIAMGIELDGQVRWTAGGREMGIEFQKPALVVQALLDNPQ